MSTREKIYTLLDSLPDNKLAFVLTYLQGLNDGMEETPDEWDLEMIKRAEKENDGTTVSIEDLASEFGIAL